MRIPHGAAGRSALSTRGGSRQQLPQKERVECRRPGAHPIVRPVAIGVVRRGDRLLVVAVCDDGGVDNSAQWIELARFRAGADRLFPVGLIEAL